MLRWWDGNAWTPHTQPPPPQAKPQQSAASYLPAIGAIVAAVGTAIALFTQVSVVSGMGTVYTGAAIAVGGLVLAWVTKASVKLKVLCVCLAALAVASAVYDQHQVDDKRHQLEQILNG